MTSRGNQPKKTTGKKSPTKVKKVKKTLKVVKSDNMIINHNRNEKKKTKIKRVKIVVDEDGKFNLDNKSTIEYHENFVPKKIQDAIFKELSDEVPWTHGVYKMFGKPVKTPRLLYAMRDEDFEIEKVYTVTKSMPWTPNMMKLKKIVEKKTGKKYSYAQLNYYRTGDDYIGYHTDSEVQDGDVIASISLGATRKFTFRSIDYKNDDSSIYEIDLEKGSLIIMDDNSAKKRWKHMLPKMKNLEDVRINITFRPN